MNAFGDFLYLGIWTSSTNDYMSYINNHVNWWVMVFLAQAQSPHPACQLSNNNTAKTRVCVFIAISLFTDSFMAGGFAFILSISLSPSHWNFPLLQSVYVFRLLGVEQTSSALLLHYFHPCLSLGQQFRIPEPSQTRSVLKRADATARVSPTARIHSRSVPLLLRIFGRTTGKGCARFARAAIVFSRVFFCAR